MDPNTLRVAIMRRVKEHDDAETATYMEDTALAAALNVPLLDIQRQIQILESNALLDVAASMGPSYAVRLTPRGELLLRSRPLAAHLLELATDSAKFDRH